MIFKKYTLCICLLFIVRTSYSSKFDQLNLELVQVLFRHGERTPQKSEVELLPRTGRSLEEPWGYAQLTNTGKIQEYKIGQMLREIYGDFLGDAYRPEYVHARSSNYDRTKASAQLVLAALYPPSGELAWDEDLKWMPIPINTVPTKLDNLFNLDSCSTFKKYYEELMLSDEMKIQLSQYQDLFKFMQKIYPNIKIDLEQIFYLNNVLLIQKSLNVPFPKWYTPQIHARIKTGTKLYMDSLSYNKQLIRLNGGGLARQMLENMDIDCTKKNPRKIYLYSGHEFTIYALAKAHNITLAKSPAFGSALILEKLRDKTGEIYVKMYYWTGPSEELIPIQLDNCDEYCSIKDYLNIVSSSLSSDDEMSCLYKNITSTELQNILVTDSYSISM